MADLMTAQRIKRDWPQILTAGEMACSTCEVVKPLKDFYKRSPPVGGSPRYRARCKACAVARIKKWRRANPERAAKYFFARNLRNKYGMSVEKYETMFADQGGVCAICNGPETITSSTHGTKIRLGVDHDHETGEVRALLCRKCNQGLGYFKDDVEFLRQAITYLGGN